MKLTEEEIRDKVRQVISIVGGRLKKIDVREKGIIYTVNRIPIPSKPGWFYNSIISVCQENLKNENFVETQVKQINRESEESARECQ